MQGQLRFLTGSAAGWAPFVLTAAQAGSPSQWCTEPAAGWAPLLLTCCLDSLGTTALARWRLRGTLIRVSMNRGLAATAPIPQQAGNTVLTWSDEPQR